MPKSITGLPCSWGEWIQESGPPGWGSLKNRDNKICSSVPWDSDLRMAALAMPGKNWKLQTRLLVREGAPYQQTCNCLKIIKERLGKFCSGSQMGAWHQYGLADWLSVVMWHWLDYEESRDGVRWEGGSREMAATLRGREAKGIESSTIAWCYQVTQWRSQLKTAVCVCVCVCVWQ
jgi:hypothetical protein